MHASARASSIAKKSEAFEQAVILVPFTVYDQGSRRFVLPACSSWWPQRRCAGQARSSTIRSTTPTTESDLYGSRLRDLVGFWAAVAKASGRCAARTVHSAWKRLQSETRRELAARFDSLADADAVETTKKRDVGENEREPAACSSALQGWKRRLPLVRGELIDRVQKELPRRTRSVSGLAVDHKRTTLSAFHADVLKHVVGTTRRKTRVSTTTKDERAAAKGRSCAGVALRTLLALQRAVDADVTSFPLSLVVLFTKDESVGNAVRDYHAYWTGEMSRREAFGKWDGSFWQQRPREKTLVTAAVYRYARLSGQRVRYLRRPVRRPFRGRDRRECDCSSRVRFCEQCLKTLSYPDVQHVPSGRSVLLDANSCTIACQTCNSSRVTSIPLRSRRNDSLTMTLAHPDRLPISVCDRRPECKNLTSNPDGDCRRCFSDRRPR